MSGISPAALLKRPPLNSSPPATEKKIALAFQEERQHTFSLLSYKFPSVILMRFPKELLGVDIPVKNLKRLRSLVKHGFIGFSCIGKVIGGLNLKKTSQPASSVHL